MLRLSAFRRPMSGQIAFKATVYKLRVYILVLYQDQPMSRESSEQKKKDGGEVDEEGGAGQFGRIH